MENLLNKALTNAPPPPPSEVKIRTMRSDIESMMRSGGGTPSFQEVAVHGLSLERKGHQAPVAERTPMPAPSSYSVPAAPVVIATSALASHAAGNKTFPVQTSDLPEVSASMPTQEFAPESASENHLMPILIVALVAIIAIGVVGYFAYVLFK